MLVSNECSKSVHIESELLCNQILAADNTVAGGDHGVPSLTG
jgi:hypothetical protein